MPLQDLSYLKNVAYFFTCQRNKDISSNKSQFLCKCLGKTQFLCDINIYSLYIMKVLLERLMIHFYPRKSPLLINIQNPRRWRSHNGSLEKSLWSQLRPLGKLDVRLVLMYVFFLKRLPRDS